MASHVLASYSVKVGVARLSVPGHEEQVKKQLHREMQQFIDEHNLGVTVSFDDMKFRVEEVNAVAEETDDQDYFAE